LEIVCFHCQQAAEKALKVILAYQDVNIPRTHNIADILTLCDEYQPGILKMFKDTSDKLSGYAVITRYPDGEMDVEEIDMRLALKCADQILSHVISILPTKEGDPQ
jgi:HEPN domain-containing protein